jgi:hypothetical protein
MKKIVISLLVLSFFCVLAPNLVSAQTNGCTIRPATNPTNILQGTVPEAQCDDGPILFSDEQCSTAGCGVNGATCCLFASILNITQWIFMLLMVIVMLLIIFGAFSIVTSSGDAEKVKKGRDAIIYALVGLAAALFSYSLPWLMRAMVAI